MFSHRAPACLFLRSASWFASVLLFVTVQGDRKPFWANENGITIEATRNDGEIHKYILHKRIGQGSEGHVRMAWSCQFYKKVAIKFFEQDKKTSFQNEKNFFEAAKNIASIPKIWDYVTWTNGEVVYDGYVMDLLDTSISEILGEVRHFNLPTVKMIASQLLETLVEIHLLGWTHSDLLAPNFMFGKEKDRLVLMDFGRATFQAKDNGELGTGQLRTPKYDLGKLGCVLMHLLTGNEEWTKVMSPKRIKQEDDGGIKFASAQFKKSESDVIALLGQNKLYVLPIQSSDRKAAEIMEKYFEILLNTTYDFTDEGKIRANYQELINLFKKTADELPTLDWTWKTKNHAYISKEKERESWTLLNNVIVKNSSVKEISINPIGINPSFWKNGPFQLWIHTRQPITHEYEPDTRPNLPQVPGLNHKTYPERDICEWSPVIGPEILETGGKEGIITFRFQELDQPEKVSLTYYIDRKRGVVNGSLYSDIDSGVGGKRINVIVLKRDDLKQFDKNDVGNNVFQATITDGDAEQSLVRPRRLSQTKFLMKIQYDELNEYSLT